MFWRVRDNPAPRDWVRAQVAVVATHGTDRIPFLYRYGNLPVWSDYIFFSFLLIWKKIMLLFLWHRECIGFLWLGGENPLGLTLYMPFLCLIKFWEVFVDAFDSEPWLGIIISCLNGVGTCFFGGKSCSCVIILYRLLGGWQFKYMIYVFVGQWTLNHQFISVDIVENLLQRNAP